MKKTNLVIDIVCSLFILLFIYAAVSKLLDYNQFRSELGRSPLLTSFSGWVAIGIPVLELLISVLLTMSKYRLSSLYSCFGLMILFSVYIIAITKFADYVPCSCGGVLSRLSWSQHLIFNSVFIGFALVAILIYPSKKASLV